MKNRQILLTLLLLLGGCQSDVADNGMPVYNGVSSIVETENIVVFKSIHYYFYDKEQRATHHLILNPLDRYYDTMTGIQSDIEDASNNTQLSAAQNAVYLSNVFHSDDYTKVGKVDLRDYSYRILKESNSNSYLDSLFSSNFSSVSISSSLFDMTGDSVSITSVLDHFVYDSYFYIVVGNTLYSSPVDQVSFKRVSDYSVRGLNISLDERSIYFLTSDYDIVRYDRDAGQEAVITSDKANGLFVDDFMVYYSNMSDHGYLYRVNKETLQSERVFNHNRYAISAIDTNNSDVYYIDTADLLLYRHNVETQSAEKVSDYEMGSFIISSDDETVYFSSAINYLELDNESASYFYRLDMTGGSLESIMLAP